MRQIVAINLSKKTTLKKTSSILSLVLHKISLRVFCGELPERSILELKTLICKLNSPSLSIVIMYSDKRKNTGWAIIKIGRISKFSNLHHFDPSIKLCASSRNLKTIEIIKKLSKRNKD